MEVEGTYEKRWVLFRVRPGDLLLLLQLMAREDVDLKAETLPPDVLIADAFYDREREQCVVVLESAFFETVQARLAHNQWSGAWNEMVFALDEDAPDPIRPFPIRGDVRWEAYLIPPERIVQILQTLSSGERYRIAALPPDTRVVDAYHDVEKDAFILWLESDFFERADVTHANGDVQLGMPERFLNLNREEGPE